MCGIVGVMLKHPGGVGEHLRRMMLTLQHRGIDSAGVAVYSDRTSEKDEYILTVAVTDVPGAMGKVGNAIGRAGGDIRNIEVSTSKHGGVGFNKYILRIPNQTILKKVIENINETTVGTVYGYGHSIELVKDIGTVNDLETSFHISKMTGTHGIGHVRFSTESHVDRRNAHPFHTNTYPDIAVVHNGQITNYQKIRRILERNGHKFMSGNDTECIIHFIVDMLQRGCSLEEALESSVEELDGPFSYVIATTNTIGVARDKLGLRPAVFSQDDSGYYIASEECALVSIDKDIKPTYLKPGEVRVYEHEID